MDPRASTPRAFDLRRARVPDVEILACETYDFLISLHVCLASPDYDYADYDIGRAWIEAARARCAERDPHLFATLGRYLGDAQPGSLHATLLSLVRQCPEPRDTAQFLNWLGAMPADDLVEALLDQDGLGDNWQALLREARAEIAARTAPVTQPPAGSAVARLVALFSEDVHATILAILRDVEPARRELLAGLRIWEEAVFAGERARVRQLQRREAEVFERRRQEKPAALFIEEEMLGVRWQRPAGLRRIVFAPSYFCSPAVFYHFWRDTLTFCAPIEARFLQPETQRSGSPAPDEVTLKFFLALGDATRLQILHLLAEREMYLTELADRLSLTKATTKHHMVKLRAAGLVELLARERHTYYALRPDPARHAAQLLGAFLDLAPESN